ncbi:hypothetical protein [Streptomyces milbemycinicus]|uniref:hypothetical protein n=1 Tax=Streptomyces milbemycinicus TaxID=476552 RepID=UPI000A394941|nr:hypothetical protein [Streptomyces milbemycinicus]
MDDTLKPLAPGTEVATIGTFYMAEVVTSEITERGHRRTVLRWTEDHPWHGIRKGDECTWVHIAGRTPRFIVTARN